MIFKVTLETYHTVAKGMDFLTEQDVALRKDYNDLIGELARIATATAGNSFKKEAYEKEQKALLVMR